MLENKIVEQLWHTRVWGVATRILCGNWGPFMRIVEHVSAREKIAGGALRRILAQVERIAA